jgi:hypothetical protein
MSSEFGELKMNNEKFDFENLVGVALRGHPSRKPTEGLPYITPNYELYNDPIVVIPAPAFARVNLSPRRRGAGIQTENTGFRIKSGMTKCVKLFLRQYTRN